MSGRLKDKPRLWSLIKSYIFGKQTSVITFLKHDVKVSFSVWARHSSTEGEKITQNVQLVIQVGKAEWSTLFSKRSLSREEDKLKASQRRILTLSLEFHQ